MFLSELGQGAAGAIVIDCNGTSDESVKEGHDESNDVGEGKYVSRMITDAAPHFGQRNEDSVMPGAVGSGSKESAETAASW